MVAPWRGFDHSRERMRRMSSTLTFSALEQAERRRVGVRRRRLQVAQKGGQRADEAHPAQRSRGRSGKRSRTDAGSLYRSIGAIRAPNSFHALAPLRFERTPRASILNGRTGTGRFSVRIFKPGIAIPAFGASAPHSEGHVFDESERSTALHRQSRKIRELIIISPAHRDAI